MSIFSYESTQGMMKKTPGPLAPPDKSLPSRKMTDLSYSWTTLTTKKSERGRETTTKRREPRVKKFAKSPGPSSHSTPVKSFIFTGKCESSYSESVGSFDRIEHLPK